MRRSAVRSKMAGRYRWGVIAATVALSAFLGCIPSSENAYAIKATVNGLAGSGLELWMNGHDPVSVEKDGEVTLAYMVSGYYYSVSVKTQPTSPAQTCTVANATGTVGSADVTNVAVTCVTSYAIGGTVSGLDGSGLVLHSSLGEDLPISGNGSFVFPTRAISGTEYVVTVKTQPTPTPPKTSETCSVGNAQGKVESSDVLNVTVICSTNAFKVGGTISGLADNATVVLQNNGTDDLTMSANTSFTFTTPVASGATYQVTVKTQPPNPWQDCVVGSGTGTIGSADVSSVTVTCTTRMFATAQLIETDNAGDARTPQVAVDTAGNAIAVWKQDDGTRYNIWANRYVAGSGWGGAQLIETDNAGWAEVPQVALDSAGNAIAVWEQYDGTRDNVWANRYVAGSGWIGAQLIETDNTGWARKPQVALDSAGNAIAVWVQEDGVRYTVRANRYVAGSGWVGAQLIETVDTNTGYADECQVAVDSAGNAIVVWQQPDGTRDNIWANRYVAGSGWGTAELIETDNAGDAYNPRVATNSSGNAIAVWQQYDGTRDNIWANRYVVGSGWVGAQLIETDNASHAVLPQVVMDTFGNAIAVWDQSDGTRGNIWANRYVAGSGWDTAQLIETDNTSSALRQQVAMDSEGNAIAVWSQSDGTRTNIWANRYVSGSGWSTPQLIETDNAGNADYPQVAMNASGSAIAVWQQSDGTRTNIWANRY